MNIRTILITVTLMVAAVACKKDLDTPPVRTLPTGSIVTIADLRAAFAANGSLPLHFTDQMSVYATVTADEQNGNLYKNVYVQDATGALNLRLLTSGSLYEGDSIRIYLPGTVLSKYNQVLQLDSVDVDNNTVKQATQRYVAPQLVTINQITPALQSMLITIENVEFALAEACNGATYANVVDQQSVDRTLTDCNSTVIVRSSGYSNFAGLPVASGNGRFTGIVGQFNSTMQLLIRDIGEVALTGPRCAPCPTPCPPTSSVQEDFASTVGGVDISLGCWNNEAPVGNRLWRSFSVSGNLCAQGRAYLSTNATDISWLITPPVTFTPGMSLSFRTQRGFGVAGHDPFALLISTNYIIGNPTAASWTPVTATYATPSTADQVWVASGSVDLGAALPANYTGNFVIGFRYTGSGPNGQTTDFRVDDVVIQ